MGRKVVKFGGSSLAGSEQFLKARDIILSDPERQLVIVSAPGKYGLYSDKVTDLLYRWYDTCQKGAEDAGLFRTIWARFTDIQEGLGLSVDLETILNDIRGKVRSGASVDFCVSRGEYLSGLLMSALLGFEFIDPQTVILFNTHGQFDSEATQEVFSQRLAKGIKAVIPGFFGGSPDGQVHVFPRGGSDISGAITARAAFADVYENWTDVPGFLMADPRVVANPAEIESITYRELRELSYSGASVLHEDAVFPVHRAGIPTIIRDTNRPLHPGTRITYDAEGVPPNRTITGIAGKKGFSVISIDKAMMNAELGFGRRVLEVIEKEGILFEHLPTGIDTMCVVVPEAALVGKRERIIADIVASTNPDTIVVHDHMAIIATVGRGMVQTHGTAARLFSAISKAGVNIRMIDQGSSEISIIVGVHDMDYDKTIRAIYGEFADSDHKGG